MFVKLILCGRKTLFAMYLAPKTKNKVDLNLRPSRVRSETGKERDNECEIRVTPMKEQSNQNTANDPRGVFLFFFPFLEVSVAHPPRPFPPYRSRPRARCRGPLTPDSCLSLIGAATTALLILNLSIGPDRNTMMKPRDIAVEGSAALSLMGRDPRIGKLISPSILAL